jgi:hypothetical protein
LDAHNITNFEFCPTYDQRDWILLQRTADLVFCAGANVEAKLVFKDFHYFKISDTGGIFQRKSFVPTAIACGNLAAKSKEECSPGSKTALGETSSFRH